MLKNQVTEIVSSKENVMGLKVKINSLDEVDESLKGLYKEVDGSFILDIMNIDRHPSVLGLSKTMKEERDARKKFEKSFKDLEKKTDGLDLAKLKDIDFEEYKNNIADLEKMKDEEIKRNKKKLKDKGEWEKLETQLRDQHEVDQDTLKKSFTGQIDEYKTKIEELSTSKEKELSSMLKSLEEQLKDKEIIAALAQAKGNVPVLMPHISKHISIVKSDAGAYVARVMNEENVQRINDTGAPMTISEFVDELKTKPEFQGEGIFEKETHSGGSGSGGNQNLGDHNNDKNPFTKEGFNLTEQMRLENQNPTEFARLKTAAVGQ